MHMKLSEYIEKYCVNISKLARKVGTTRTYFYKIVKGHVPSVKIAKSIQQATDGRVTKEELLFPEEYEKEES